MKNEAHHKVLFFFSAVFFFISCSNSSKIDKSIEKKEVITEEQVAPEEPIEEEVYIPFAERLVVEKDLAYDKYTLEDQYEYKDTFRIFQWDKIKAGLILIDSLQSEPSRWGVGQNRKNKNGEAALVENYSRNKHKNIIDEYGVERFQSIPLYEKSDTLQPRRYTWDGSLVKILNETETQLKAEAVHIGDTWIIPRKYIKEINESGIFSHVVFVDKTNQNIMTLERETESKWLVRSMNPATTGLEKPPYMHDTPAGIFVIQEKKEKMYFLVDGTNDIAGFSPYASRFSNGGYIHGIPTNYPRETIIEYSRTLGTTPRSHMCVRNASSHAKFVYEWAPTFESLVFVIE